MAIIRGKNPQHDLKLRYRKIFWISTAINCVLMTTVAVIFPEFQVAAGKGKKDQIIINMEDIPETRQVQRPPPPPRPAVPIETDSEDVPDDVTIESTDLDFDEAIVDLPPPPPPGSGDDMEEEVLEFFMVEDKPVIIKSVAPIYPEIAQKAGLSGRVFVRFKVGRDGRVSEVQITKGEEIFRQAAIDAVSQFVFTPAMQNDKPVAVWMSQFIRFDLN